MLYLVTKYNGNIMLYRKEKEININLQGNILFHIKRKHVLTCPSLHEWGSFLVSYEEEWCGTWWKHTHTHTDSVSLHAFLFTNQPGTCFCGFSCMFCSLLFSQFQYLWELQHISPHKNTKAWICPQRLSV